MRLVAAGLSFRTAPLPVREAAAVREADARSVLRFLVGHAGFSGAAVLSTCNRTDFYVTCPDADGADVVARLAPTLDPQGSRGIAPFLTTLVDAEAVRHMFRVAAGVESMVLGEAQVLGQVKDAAQLARDAGTLDSRLDFVLRRCLSVGKLVRSSTHIGRGAGSLSEVAVDAARSVRGDLDGCGVLLVGAGTMSLRAARRLRAQGARILVTSRGDTRLQLAREVEATAVSLSRLLEVAEGIDVVISSTSAAETVLPGSLVAAIQEVRGGRPLCIVDLALPRDVDPAAGSLPGVTLLDIDALGRRLEGSLRSRSDALPEALEIIERELQRTMAVIGRRDAAAPTITALLRRAEAIRRREVEHTLARRPGLDAAARECIDVVTSSLVRKLLHGPVSHLREAAEDPAAALVLRQAFDLDEVELTGMQRGASPAAEAGSRE